MRTETFVAVLLLMLIGAGLFYGVLELKTQSDIRRVDAYANQMQASAHEAQIGAIEAYINQANADLNRRGVK